MREAERDRHITHPEHRNNRQKLVAWISQWGFGILVTLGILGAAYVAWRVNVPDPVPNFALRAEAVYRIEVGAAAFLGSTWSRWRSCSHSTTAASARLASTA